MKTGIYPKVWPEPSSASRMKSGGLIVKPGEHLSALHQARQPYHYFAIAFLNSSRPSQKAQKPLGLVLEPAPVPWAYALHLL